MVKKRTTSYKAVNKDGRAIKKTTTPTKKSYKVIKKKKY